MLDKQKFPDSSIAALNADCHEGAWRDVAVRWSLVADQDRFHVFLVAQIQAPVNLEVRIDWRAVSRLEFEPHVRDTREEMVPVGETRGFCRLCAIAHLRRFMQDYNLFVFNCRTVSYLLLTELCRFDPARTYDLFDEHELLCGLQMDECLSVTEIEHYIHHRQTEAAQEQQRTV